MPKSHRKPKSRKRQKVIISPRSEYPVIRVFDSWKRLNQSKKKVVYFIRGDKPVKYRRGKRSRILYIGSTERNAKRPFESLRDRAEKLFEERGIRSLDVVYIEARGRKRLEKLEEMLEDACLYQFRNYYGLVPTGNIAGSERLPLDNDVRRARAKRYFNFDRIEEVLRQLSEVES